MIVATPDDARELVASWTTDNETPYRTSAEGWRRLAKEREHAAVYLEICGRSGADVEREIAAIFKAAAEAEDVYRLERDRLYDEKLKQEQIASDAYMKACGEKHK